MYLLSKSLTVAFIENFIPQNKEEIVIVEHNITLIQSSLLTELFSLSIMATLRNKRKLASVSRETPEISGNSRSQNTLDPELAQDYISQVSEDIEGRVTEKLSKESSRTESRLLGALSKLEEFLLNPQVRTGSAAVPCTSRNSDSENREPTGDRSLNDPCLEVVYSSHHSGHLSSSEVKEYPHIDTHKKQKERAAETSQIQVSLFTTLQVPNEARLDNLMLISDWV